jgi:addiction module antidote-like protein
MAAYLQACLEEAPDDPALIAAALGDIARARGMVQLAKETGLTREAGRPAMVVPPRSAEHVWDVDVAGSNPVAPTKNSPARVVSCVAMALASSYDGQDNARRAR